MVRRMLKSFMPHFDGLAVAITGTSGKYERLQRAITDYGGEYVMTSPDTHPLIYRDGKFAHFAEARNVSWSLAQKMQKKNNYDWWAWADADDILLDGNQVRKAAKLAKGVDTIFFSYWYSVRVDKKGTIEEVIIDHLRERLIKPNIFKWISRLHEVLVPIEESYKASNSLYDVNPEEGRTCAWVHLPGEERTALNLKRNLEILDLQLKEQEGKDPRTRFYLAKTYMDLASQKKNEKYLDKASDEFKVYLDTSGWAEERGNAWELMGNIYDMKKEHFEAIDCYHMAVKENPTTHLPYLRLCKKYTDLGRFEEADHWMDVASHMPPPKARTTMSNPLEIKLTLAMLKYNKALREQHLKDAIYWIKMTHKLQGKKDDGIVKTLEESVEMDEAAKGIFKYAKWLKKHHYSDKIEALLESIAPDFKNEQFVQHIANDIQKPKDWPNKSIVYFAGPTFEPWDDLSMKKGLGGSETAIVMLSREWAELGYDVTVYCDTPNEGTRRGVKYKHWATFNWNDKFQTLIVWRNTKILSHDIKAKRLYYDAHDIEAQTNWSPEAMKRIDKVFFKSNWHRSHVPKLPDSKAVVISNGIL